MPSSDTTTKFKADISQLKAAMQQAQRAVRLANSEFKAATAGLDDWSSSAVGLQAKLTQLDSTLKAQKRQVTLLNEEYEKTVAVYGKNSAEADRAKIALNNQEAAVAKTEKQIAEYTQELQECEDGTGRFANELDDLDDAAAEASEGFTVMKGALASLVADGVRLAIDAIKDLAKETIQVGMNFDSAMSQVEAVSGATAEEMEQLRDKAKEMGEKTKFSATEAAEAFNYMAMAGWKTEDMLGGIEGIMNLAAASGEDLASTSDIVTDALTAMGYSAADSGKLADVMAAASSNANTNVAMMGQTFQYAAPIIGALGYSMEDAAVAIGLMANAGIKGEKSGTALRSILTRLSAPPKECADAMDELGISLTDSEGNMKSLDEVMGDLRKAFDGLSETEQTAYAKSIAGQEAMSGLLAIVNAAPADFNKLTKAVEESNGAAQAMAETMQDNVGGQITLLKSKIEGIMIKVWEKASDSIRSGIDTISEGLDNIDWDTFGEKVGDITLKAANFFKTIIENSDGILAVLKSVGTVLLATFAVNKITAFATTISGLYKTFKSLKTATDAATASQQLLNLAQAATPIGLVTAAVAGLVTGIGYLIVKNKEAKESTAVLTEEEQKQIDKVHEMSQAYEDMKTSRDESIAGINAEFSHYSELATELNGLVDANGKVKEGYEDRANFILTTLNEALGTEMEMTDGIIQNYQEEKKAIDELIQTKKAQAILNANEELYTVAIQNRDAALQEYINTQNTYNEKVQELSDAEKAYNDIMAMTTAEYAEANGLTWDMASASQQLANEQEALYEAQQNAGIAMVESKNAMREAESTYIGYIGTIQNYEGLSAAIISGDTKKINEALMNMQNDFITAEIGTKESLQNQVRNMQANYEALKQAIESNTPGVTQEMVDQAAEMVKKAEDELEKYVPGASEIGKTGGEAFAEDFAATKGQAENAGKEVGQATDSGAKSGASGLGNTGHAQALLFVNGIKLENSQAYTAGEGLGNEAKSGTDSVSGTTSGENFGQGYADGIESKNSTVYNKAFGLAQKALSALQKSQKEGSPSKITTQSGVYFGEGYENGINSMVKDVTKSAVNLGVSAYQSLRKAQKEGSPSKLTYASGVNFTKGYINGIASMQKNLTNSVKSIVGGALKQALNLQDFNFSEVANDVSTYFSDELTDKMDYMLAKMAYQNEKKIEDFDDTIQKLQDKMSNTEDANLKKQYQAQIDEQNKIKSAYQSASSAMISEFTSAMNAYQSKAQALVDATINGITSSYEQRYNDLISKQDNLISKLKSAGDLFEISGAGIMTVNDITEQTKQIKEYASKLQRIKEKVSSDLFDKISSYDMDQGNAFMDRLLALSDADLKAYSDAYDEKMSIAEQLGESTYKKDFQDVAKEYKNTVNNAFKGLPKQLENIGIDTMKGFINGLTKNTDYMDSSIQTFVKGMVDQFKKELKIGSPSKVTELLGEFTGEGFGNGLKNMIGYVKEKASDLAQSVSTPLDDFKGSIDSAKLNVNRQNASASQNNVVTNNYNLVQNNNSPKSLSALETYRARRQQIAMMKAATQNA